MIGESDKPAKAALQLSPSTLRADNASRRPGLDFVGSKAPVAQDGGTIGAARARGSAHLGGRAAEAGCGRRLHDAIAFDEGGTRRVVWVTADLAQGEHGCNAGVAAREDALPIVARALLDGRGEAPTQFRPAVAVVLGRQLGGG